jgi:16S rRNA (guanine1516-N2)-methyltransferase
MIERSPIIYALLEDGLKRATANPLLREVINGNIVLKEGNAVDVLAGLPYSPDTILLDPMYPQEKRRSLNKISMRILRDLVGDDDDCEELFRASLAIAQNRVAVKRPKGAAAIVASPPANHRIDMKSGRFDVYLNNHLTFLHR